MEKPEALRLADELIRWDFAITRGRAAAELRRLHAENDALLEALRYISKYTGEGSMYTTPWQDIVADLGQKARAAIAAVEGEAK